MKKKNIKNGIWALALALLLPAAPAEAMEIGTFYLTPRVIYSYQTGDMASTRWNGGGPFRAGIVGGEDNDSRFGFGLALGADLSYATSYPVRVEVEYIYHGAGEFKKGPRSFTANGRTYSASQEYEVKAHSLMANVFYDFNTNSTLTPYIGGGLGVGYLDTKFRTGMSMNGRSGSARLSNTDWNLAWNLGGGLAWYVSDSVAIDLGYRYVDLGKGEAGNFNIQHLGYSGSPRVDYTAHEFSVGLRFSGF